MSKILGSNGDIVSVEITQAKWVRGIFGDENAMGLSVTAKDENGHTGTADIKYDKNEYHRFRENESGSMTLADVLLEDCKKIGWDGKNPRQIPTQLVGKKCEFYLAVKEKGGSIYTNYYLQVGSGSNLEEISFDDIEKSMQTLRGGHTSTSATEENVPF